LDAVEEYSLALGCVFMHDKFSRLPMMQVQGTVRGERLTNKYLSVRSSTATFAAFATFNSTPFTAAAAWM
jgi:hypothetical protein